MAMEQGAPAPEQAPQPEGGGGMEQAMTQVGQGLGSIASQVGQSNAPDELKQGFAQLAEQFAQLAQALMTGGGEAAPGPQGPQPAEAGANPNARPLGPQG